MRGLGFQVWASGKSEDLTLRLLVSSRFPADLTRVFVNGIHLGYHDIGM